MLQLAKENDLGAPLQFVYLGQWDWYLECEKGKVWSKHDPPLRP